VVGAVPDGIVKKVSEVYEWIGAQILEAGPLAGECAGCGECCDFEAFGHKLFVTSAEVLRFSVAHGGAIKEMTGGRCPYNVEGRCTSYESRFAGCRIFSCEGDADFQSGLTEAALKKLKSLCIEYDVRYRYMDLASALNRGAAEICR
jgi:hypothetical protein